VEDGRKMGTNTETSGRYHTNWLNMMYPRLKLARNLLREDGVIFISIDDTEVANLRKLCDEIFGEENFVTQLVWAGGRKNDSKLVSVSHEYIVCYVKNIAYLNEQKIIWRQRKKGLEEIYAKCLELQKSSLSYAEMTTNLKEWYKELPNSHPSKSHKHYNTIDARGVYFPSDISWPGGGGPKYTVLHPVTKQPVKIPSRGWVYSDPQRMQQAITDDLVHFGEDENSVPCLKSYLRDRETQVPYSVFYQDGRASTKRLRSLMDSDYFDHPKDEDILQELLDFSSGDSAIILDFFAGSCTTAQSVMALNSVDSGSRKFIMVQLPEPTDKPDYPTIADIGKERIRRAGKKILADNAGKDGIDRLDVGFKTFKLDSTNIKPWNIGFDQLESDLPLFADSLKDDRSAEDVLYEILLKYGLDLSLPITTHTLAGKTVYNIGMGALVVCLDQAITLDTVEGIAKLKDELQPETAMRVVFRDSGFADDVVKVNAVQILKQAGIEDVRSV